MDIRKYGRQGNYKVPLYYLKLDSQIPEEDLEHIVHSYTTLKRKYICKVKK